jgi:methionyl-tRNA formyltransferase
VTVIHMTPRIDAGPCIAQLRTAIGPDETAGELEPRLAELGAPLICETIRLIESGRAAPLPQDASQASRAPRLKKTDGLIDWTRPALAIKNHVRAMEPWPKTYTFWHPSSGAPVRLILGPLAVIETSAAGVAPGTVIEAGGQRLVIAAGKGAVMPASGRWPSTSFFAVIASCLAAGSAGNRRGFRNVASETPCSGGLQTPSSRVS